MTSKVSEYVYYDETSPSGIRWKVHRDAKNAKKIHEIAGTLDKHANRWVVWLKLDGVEAIHYCHRIVWELHNGCIESGMVIDHINGDSSDNKIDNLRATTRMINSRNMRKHCSNKSGVTGVCLVKNKIGNEYFAAHYSDNLGKRKMKLFSILKFGVVGAKELATEYRKKMTEEFGHYTERHGK